MVLLLVMVVIDIVYANCLVSPFTI